MNRSNADALDLWDALERVTNVTARFVRPRFFKNMGHSGQVPEQIQMLRRMVTQCDVHTVCEVGFNAGHSATAFLHGLQTRLKSFDFFRLPYSNASQQYISECYPGRVEYFRGSTRETVPRYVSGVQAAEQPPCDLWFIDGDHRTPMAAIDLRNALQAASADATIIADDCTERYPAVQAAWRKMVLRGDLMASFNYSVELPFPAGLKGWCVGSKKSLGNGLAHHRLTRRGQKCLHRVGFRSG